jgi:CAAX protease family protein
MHTITPSPRESPRKIVQLASAFEGGLILLAVVIGWIFRLEPQSWIAWTWRDFALGLLATIPMLVGLLIMRRIRRGPLGRLNSVVDQTLVPLFGHCNLLQLVLISLLAGVGEELLFRGAIQSLLGNWFGSPTGLIVTSVVFGLLHLITPTYGILAGCIGLYLGWFAIASGNLLGPIVAHGLYDFLALALLTGKLAPQRRDLQATHE